MKLYSARSILLDWVFAFVELLFMRPPFQERRATQVAARLLTKEGGAIDILKLVKLVYLVDRESLIQFGRPVTFDRFYSMPHGPVVSSTLDCINATDEVDAPYWLRHISQRDGNAVRLVTDPGTDELSPATESLIEEVYAGWGRYSGWQLRNKTHELPEWRDPGESKRTPLKYRDVLEAAGWPKEDIEAAYADLKAEASFF